MYINRKIDKELIVWKNTLKRKPLLLRGARQVGKTESVRNFAKQFQNFIEINFEEQKNIHSVFEDNLSPKQICENLSIVFKTKITSGKTLLFFDEIQTCVSAIQSLRYFYEKMPNLHLIAAGSLLEFALEEIPSFGVGRIRSIFMYPLSFNEFLFAFNESALVNAKQKSTAEKPLNDALHIKLLKYLKKFIILGGMPEVTANYVQTNDFNNSLQILDDLIFSFRDDFVKYKKRVPVSRINNVFNSIVLQTGGKFIYSKAAKDTNHKQIKEALELLILAGIVFPVTHTDANGLPLGAEVNQKKQKMLLLDTGLFLRILNLDISEILLSSNFNIINKGSVAELFVGLELLKYQSCYRKNDLYYWHREAKNSNAELDYLYAKDSEILPIEVKAGTKGAMQSMNLFLKEKKYNKGIRISLENFSQYKNIFIYPLYAISNIIKEQKTANLKS